VPGKALVPIDGVPLVEHVRRRVAGAEGVDAVVVATDDERVAAAVRAGGGDARITGPARNGTRRVAAILDDLDAAIVLNVQGDQPGLDPAHVTAVAALIRGGAAIASLATPLHDPSDPAAVKVVFDDRGDALYFSRLPIPRGGPWWRHLGVYGFTAAALRACAETPVSGLAVAEDLEQLDWLAAGHRVRIGTVASAAPALDTPDQLRAWTDRDRSTP